MTFADLVPGESVFLDANIFVLHFEPHAVLGPPCTQLLKRIELQTGRMSHLIDRLLDLSAAQVAKRPTNLW